jgi:hypothetical protein
VLGKSERGERDGNADRKAGNSMCEAAESRAARTEQGNIPRKGERMREV